MGPEGGGHTLRIHLMVVLPKCGWYFVKYFVFWSMAKLLEPRFSKGIPLCGRLKKRNGHVGHQGRCLPTRKTKAWTQA